MNLLIVVFSHRSGRLLINAAERVPTLGLNRSFIRQHEHIANAFAVGAFFIAVIPGCLAECTLIPIRCFGSDYVDATTPFRAVFGTSTVCDPHIVTSVPTL